MTRWWAPGGTPVEHLLRRGPDPEKDLGLALLAVHKAGAEACELVAQTALADEMVLAAALAETRSLIAKPAVQVISKGVGTPQYAGLLLADLLDDAESAALSLYRSCLAKSVAPPVAAQRVGLVFGVPSRRLGPFSKLATDPKSNPVAVQDAADRALFDYVAHVVTEEYVPLKEAVSKAPTREYHGDDPDERDSQGRFARLRTQTEGGGKDVLPGVSLQDLFDAAAAPKEVATPAQDTTPGPQVARQRPMRRVRQVRRMHPGAEQATQQAMGQQMGQRTGRRMVTAMTRKLTAQELAVQQLLEVEQASVPMPLSGQPRSVPDLTKQRHHLEGAKPLQHAISFVLTDAEYMQLTNAAKASPHGVRTLRLGGLEEYAGKARRHQEAPGVAHEDHITGVSMVLDIELGQGRYADVENLVDDIVHADQLDTADLLKSINKAKDDFLEKQAAKLNIPINVVTERGRVSFTPDKDRANVFVLTWRPPKVDRAGRRDVDRPGTPGVVEIVIPAGTVAGIEHRDGRIEVDPNAVIQVLGMRPVAGAQAPQGLVRQIFWDPKLRAIRTLVTARDVSESEINKAQDYHGREPGERDSEGKFARVLSHRMVRDPSQVRVRNDPSGAGYRGVEVVPGMDLQALFDQAEARHSTPQARVRPMRRMARVRNMHASPAQPVAQTMGQSMGQQTGQKIKREHARLAMQQAARQTVKDDPIKRAYDDLRNLLFLDEEIDHSVVTPEVLSTIMDRAKFKGYVEEGATIPLNSKALTHLAETEPSEASTAELDLMAAAIAQWNKAQGRTNTEDSFAIKPTDKERPVLTHIATDEEELDYLASYLVDQMDQDQSLSMLRVQMITRDDGRVHIKVTGNVEKLPEMNIVGYVDVEDVDQVRQLRAGKTYRMQNKHSLASYLHMTWHSREAFQSGRPQDRGRAQEVLANPHVRVWTAE